MSGSAWREILVKIDELLATPDFESAKRWLEAHIDDPKGRSRLNMNYRFSKEALVAYMKWRTWPLAERRIRINTLSPGITVTPMIHPSTPSRRQGIPSSR